MPAFATRSYDWCEPLRLASVVSEPMVLLYSSLRRGYSGRYSFLAVGVRNLCTKPEGLTASEDIPPAFQSLVGNQGEEGVSVYKVHAHRRVRRATPQRLKCEEYIHPLLRWYGYLGYPLRHQYESLPNDAPAPIPTPALWLMQPETVYCFDHEARTLTGYSHHPLPETLATAPLAPPALSVATLTSNLTKAKYLEAVQATIAQIHSGNFYQANITRKFYGSFAKAPDPLALFGALCQLSPSPYSAFIRTPAFAVLSSSPEQFLTLDASGALSTRPIKGSLAREAGSAALAASLKDRAENLMIVDLMRNDFSRVAVAGSVETGTLFEIDSFSTIHHMATNVRAQLAQGHDMASVLAATFPPGSMTGAPKIAAMRWCSQMEGIERGIYSGALGWLSADQADLSVVIRTLIMHENQFEFQVGGGIVADSDPVSEWQETLTKARAIAACLQLSPEILANL